MRIVVDNHDNFTGKSYPYIMEFMSVDISPVFVGENKTTIPDELVVELKHFDRPEADADWCGRYPMDGTEKTLKKALASYTHAVNKLLSEGYANLIDFGDVDWD